LVRADHRAGPFTNRLLVGGGGTFGGWRVALQEIPRRLVRPEQLLDPRPAAGIPGARPVEEGGPFLRPAGFHRLAEKGHDLTLWYVHDDPPRAGSPVVNARLAGKVRRAGVVFQEFVPPGPDPALSISYNRARA